MTRSPRPFRNPFVVLNPAAGRGRRSRRTELYLSLLRSGLGEFEHARTRGPGDEAELVDRALDEGADLIVAIGGDGTWSNVADRIAAFPGPEVPLGLLPAGTGNDFARGLGISARDPEAAVACIVRGRSRPIDMGRGTFRGGNGARTRSFLLVAGFGLDTAVLLDMRRARFVPGALAYRLAALRQIFTFGSVTLDFSSDSGHEGRGEFLMLALCNGASIGGSFQVAPSARLDDGALDACAVKNGGMGKRISVFRKAMKGTHGASPLVDLFRCGRLSVDFDRPTPYQIDGELQEGKIEEARLEVIPGGIRVLAPEGSEAGTPSRGLP